MNRLSIIVVTILLVSNIANAQSYWYQRGFVALSMGVTSPSYAFGNHQGTDLHSYANPGICINGEAAYFYSKHIGLDFLINYGVNTVNNNKLAEGYLNSSPVYKTVSAQSEAFREISGFAGLIFDFPANEYISFVFKMMIGLQNLRKPTALIKTTTVFSTIDYYETSDNKTNFALYNSLGLKVVLNDNFSLQLNASYVGSTYDFEFERNNSPVEMSVHAGLIALAGGISYSF